jgi:septum formation protein
MLVLASGSPRRNQLLKMMGLTFRVRPARIPERRLAGERPEAMAVRLARAKAHAGAINLYPGVRGKAWVLGADTIVTIDGRVLGKPRDAPDARRMLRMLSGRTHRVVTGVAIWSGSDGGIVSGRSITRVTFSELTRSAIESYVATGEPMDVAGAYAIQGLAGVFIPRISGSWSNVVGLPLDLVERLLSRSGYSRKD